MAGDPNSFPYDCVVLIESPDPYQANTHFVGSGVVVGPHTILTASHVVYDFPSILVLYPGWESTDPGLGPAPFPRLTLITSILLIPTPAATFTNGRVLPITR